MKVFKVEFINERTLYKRKYFIQRKNIEGNERVFKEEGVF